MVVTPSAYNRIVENGSSGPGVLRVTTRCAAIALLPLAVCLGGDVGLAMMAGFGMAAATAAGAAVGLVALGA